MLKISRITSIEWYAQGDTYHQRDPSKAKKKKKTRFKVDSIHSITRNKSKCFSTITNLITFFLKELLEKIWKPRCQLMIDKEKSLGITKKIKIKKGAVSTLEHSTDNHVPSAWETWIHLANKYGNSFLDF